MSDAKGKKKKVIAIILILAIVAGVLAFLFLNSLVSEGKIGLEVETSKLTQKGNKFLLSITIKNIGLEPLTKVNVAVNGDEQFFCDFSDDPLQANETRVIVLKLEKTYEVGNSYTIDVQVPLVGECLQTITFSITAEHEPEVEKVNVKFQVEGLDATATGTVLVVDSVAYSAPPETFEWEVGSSHTFEWCENISSTSPSKLFMWETTTGLSNKRFDTLTASENGTVKATYRLTEETTIGKVVFTVEGLNADTTGVLLIVDGVNYSSLPQTFLWANGTEHSFQYSQTVSSTTTDKQYSLLEVNGPQSPLTVTTTLLVITGYYAAEYKVTFMQQGLTCAATGMVVNITYLNESFSLTYDNLPFSLWVRDKLFFSFSKTVEGFLNEARFRLVSVNASSPFEPSSYTVIIATYHLQYRLIINTSPSEGGTTDPPVGTHWFDYCTSVNVTAFSAPDYTFEFWILNGANVGSDNPIRIPIDQNHNLTAVFIEKGKVTFMAEGLGPDANSSVLTVDGVYYLYPDLPIVFTWDTDSPHDFAWHSPISIGELKQYVWVKTSGLSDLQTGTVIAPASGGIVLAKYNTTFSVIFDATGLDDSATGTVLTVDGASYSKTDLPLVFNWEESSVHTYAFADTVDSIIGGKHFILVEVTGLVSPLTVEGSTTIIGHYKVQWQITFDQTGLDSSATGTVVTVDGVNKAYPDLPFSKWVDDGTVVVYTYANPISGSSPEKQFELISVTGPASPVVVSANTVVIGNYQLQWQITFDQTGLDSSATGVVVTVDGVSKAYSDLPFSKWVNDGTTVVYSYSNPVSSSTSGKHFNLSSVTGLPSPVTVSSSVTVAGNYVTQLELVFTQTGLDSSATGTVVTVNGAVKTYAELPHSLWVNVGSVVTYSFSNPVLSTTLGKRFNLLNVTGSSSSITVTAPETIIGNYKAQWPVTFDQTGLDSSATGTIVTVNGIAKSYSELPYSAWFDDGSSVTYSYVISTHDFTLVGVTGPSSPVLVTSSVSIIGNYYESPPPTEYTVMFTQTGLDSTAEGTVLTVNGVSISYASLPYAITVSVGSSVSYSYVSPKSSSTSGKRFILNSISGPSSPITVYHSYTVTGNYITQWQVAFTHSGLESSATGTVVTIDSIPKTYADMPFLEWADAGSTVSYGYTSPVSSSTTGKRFSLSSVSGPSSPITVTSATTVTGNYLVQWQITFLQTGLDSTATGTVVTVDGSSFGYGSLPYSKWVDSGSLVVYSYASPVSSSTPSTQFTLTGVSGSSSPVTVTSAVTVIGNYTVYTIQLSVTFTHTGLDSSATGTVVTVNGVLVQFSSLPYTLLVASGSSVTYSYSSPVSSLTTGKRFSLSSITGPASPIIVASNTTVTGNYQVQWLITFQCCYVLDSSAVGTVLTVDGLELQYAGLPYFVWANHGSIVTYEYSPIVMSTQSGKRFRFTMFFGPASPITVTGATTVTGQYEVQWQVTFTHSGLDSSATGTVVTVDGAAKAYADLPFSKWVDNWASVTYSYSSPVSSSTTGKRFSLGSVSGPTSPIAVTSAVTVTGNYVVQWRVTFAQTGLDSSATGTVVTVDASTKTYGNLPFSKWVDEGATVVYVYSDPVSSTITGKRFHLSSVTGSASPIIVSSALTITGNYVVQWQIIFTQTGLDSTATGTVVTVNTQNKGYSNLPYSLWVESGATVSYTFFDPVSSSTSGERFKLSSVTGAASPVIVTSYTTVTGNYFTQWLVTFDQTGLDSSATGTVVAVNTTTIGYSGLPYSIWMNNNLIITYSYSNPVTSSTPGKQFNLTGVTGATSPITVTSAQTIIGNYVVYCTCFTVTFTHTGLDSSATGTIVTVNGVNVAYSSLPYSVTVSYGGTVTYTYYTPISSSTTGKRFRLISVTGLSSPITVTSSITIIGNYIKQYLVTFSHTGLGPCANGTVVTINGTAKGYSALPYSDWYDEGTTLSYTYHSPVSTVILGKRFLLVNVTDLSSPITVTSPLTIIGNYVPQYFITWTQTGLDSSATGTVVTVNGTSKSYVDLPFSDWFNNGATVIYAYSSPVSSSTPSIQFILTGVTGLTSPITVSSSTTIIGNYNAQCICFQVVFTQTGLDSSATGTVLVVNGVDLQYSNLPYTITVSSGGVVTYAYTSTVSSSTSGKRFRLVSVVGPSSPITVTSSVTVTGNYVVQWFITWTQTGLDSSATGTVVTVNEGGKTYVQLPFSDWFDNGATVTYQYLNPVTSSTPGKSFTLTGVSGQASPITVTNTATIIGQYCTNITQFTVTFTHVGLDSSATGTIVVVNGTNVPYSNLPYSILVSYGDTVTYSYLSPVSSSTSGKRFRLVSVSGASSPITVTSSLTVTGNYLVQWQVTFTHSGLDASATGTVVTVNGVSKTFGDLAFTDWYDNGATITYSYQSLVSSSTTGKRFRLVSVTGPSSPITVTSAVTVTGNYMVQWQVTFTHSGLDSSATGTVVTVNGVGKSYSDLPFTDWYNTGASITYSYFDPVSSSTTGKRFDWTSNTGSASPITVSASETITGNYVVQWQLTFTHSGLDSSATGTVVTVNGGTKAYTDLPFTLWVDTGSSVTYLYSSTVSSSVANKRFRLSSVTGPTSPITVTSSITVTGNYVVQWQVTFTQTGLDSSATGTVVTVNSVSKTFGDLAFTDWYDNGATITYSYFNPVSSAIIGKRFSLTSVSGSTSPITVTSATTVTGNYVVQWQVTFTHSGLDSSATGTVLVVNGVDLQYSNLPYTITIGSGGVVTYAYTSTVSSSTSGKRFGLVSVTGPSSPITVTSSVTVTGNYVQWQVILTQIAPTADSWVESSHPKDNHGSDTKLHVRVEWDSKKGKVTNLRRTYIKFDLSGLLSGAVIDSALLHLYRTTADLDIPAAYQTTDGWTEAGINWNNAPAPGAFVADGTPGSTWISWNITSYAAFEFAGDKILSVVVRFTTESGSDQHADFTSREGTLDQRPWLEISYSIPPAVVYYSVTFDAGVSPLPDVADDTVIVTGMIWLTSFAVTNVELPETFTDIAEGTTITYTTPVPSTVLDQRYRCRVHPLNYHDG